MDRRRNKPTILNNKGFLRKIDVNTPTNLFSCSYYFLKKVKKKYSTYIRLYIQQVQLIPTARFRYLFTRPFFRIIIIMKEILFLVCQLGIESERMTYYIDVRKYVYTPTDVTIQSDSMAFCMLQEHKDVYTQTGTTTTSGAQKTSAAAAAAALH